jgi:hypothetical protein
MFHLESVGSLDAHEVIYIPSLKKKLLSVLAMEDRDFFVTFHRGNTLICIKKYSPENALVVGVREHTLYSLQGKPFQDLVHKSDNLCELWNKRLGHLHYRELPILREIVISLLEFSIEK